MKLNKTQFLNIETALQSKDLKAKHVSGENYLTLLKLKKDLRVAREGLIELEKIAIVDCGEDQEALRVKITQIHDAFSFELVDPFLTLEEFKAFVKELDTEPASIIAEFLLKDF